MKTTNLKKALGISMLFTMVLTYWLVTMPPVVQAAEFIVTREDDPEPDFCAPNDCSLREAILAANDSPGPDVIRFEGDTSITYRIGIVGSNENGNLTGDLDIIDDLEIIGNGIEQTIIDGSGIDRVFHILNGTVSFSKLTIQGGNAATNNENGGGILYTIDQGILAIVDSRITGNSARAGGGISNTGNRAIINIVNSTIDNNNASLNGGGVNISEVILADANILGSAIINNEARNDGGGIYFLADPAAGEKVVMNIINSTISSNTSQQYGGGVVNEGNGEVNLQNSTIAFNTVDREFFEEGGGGGVASVRGGQFNISNTIIGQNTDEGDNPSATEPEHAPDCVVFASEISLASLGYNIVGDSTNCAWQRQSTDQLDIDPLLDENLISTNQSTAYHPLLPGSPARDQGSPDIGGRLGQCVLIDQQGYDRRDNPPCDVGAYEFLADRPTLNLTVIKSGPELIDELGQSITYTLSVINSSLLPANNVVITDVIPDLSFYVTGGERFGEVISWSTPSVAADELFFATFVVTSSDPVRNVDYRVTADNFASDGFNEVGTTLVDPDLSIELSIHPARPRKGEVFTYTLTVENTGGRTAPNLVITNTLPSGANYVSGGELVGNTVRWPAQGADPITLAGVDDDPTTDNTLRVSYMVTTDQVIVNDDYGVRSVDDKSRVYSATGTISITTYVEYVMLPVILKQR